MNGRIKVIGSLALLALAIAFVSYPYGILWVEAAIIIGMIAISLYVISTEIYKSGELQALKGYEAKLTAEEIEIVYALRRAKHKEDVVRVKDLLGLK